MDAFFHISQGMLLIEKKDTESIKKALNHFREANMMTSSGDIAKPTALYYLAYGNLVIGNIERAYILINKAHKELEISRNSSVFIMDKFPGEERIIELLTYLDKKFPELKKVTETDHKKFDENYLDLSKVSLLYKQEEPIIYEKHVNIDNISNETLMMVFAAMLRNDDSLIYFDIVRGEPLSYIEGYFVPSSGDHVLNNRMLANKIMHDSPMDAVDEERHKLIPRLIISDFIDEFKKQIGYSKEFENFISAVSDEILEDFKYADLSSLDDLFITHYTLEFFCNSFHEKIGKTSDLMMKNFNNILAETSNSIVKIWIQSIL